MTALRMISTSEAGCKRRCTREHHLRYRLLRRPNLEAHALRFGSLIHRGLEAWWRLHQARGESEYESALEFCIDVMRVDESDPFDLARAEAMMIGYDARWSEEPIEVLAVESEFDAGALVNPATGAASRTFKLCGKIDAIARIMGKLYTVEHKTSSEDIGAGSDYWRRLRMDPQISDYFVGARSLGYEPAGCLYDVLGKPQLKPKLATPVELRKYKSHGLKMKKKETEAEFEARVAEKTANDPRVGQLHANQREEDETPEEFRDRLIEHIGENPDRYYQRGTVVRLEEQERDAAYDLWQTARNIRDSELADRYPRTPGACVRYGRTCDYFDVCTNVESIDDDLRFRTAGKPHEELSSAAT